jgi:hypothetical protein
MTVPAWLLDIFAAIMLAVAAVSALRLAAARPWQRGGPGADADIDLAHLLMGIAMAGMLTASLTTLPDGAWEAVFAVTTAWFAWRVARDVRGRGASALAGGHHAPHLVHSAAMLYMFGAVAAPMGTVAEPAMAGMGGAAGGMSTLRFPTIALVFALLLAGYAVWDLDQVASRIQRTGERRSTRSGLRLSDAGVPALAGPGNPVGGLAAATGTGMLPGGHAAAPGDSAAVPDDSGARPGQAGVAGIRDRVLAPDVATGCRIAMGVTMALMLVLMI